MTTTVHHTGMGSRTNEELVCNAFTSNIFKPDYCSHCYKARTAHAVSAMPLQNMSNCHRHRTSVGEQGKDKLESTAGDVWVRKGSEGLNHDQHKKQTGSKSQNSHQSFQKGTGRQNAMEHSKNLETGGVPVKHVVQNGVANNGSGSANGGAVKGSHDPNLYEAIYPTDDNIENFDNQANAVLESSHMKQRSYSDVRTPHCSQGRDMSRRISTPSPYVIGKNKPVGDNSTNSNVFEFQKLAGRLKHTNRKDAVEVTSSGDARGYVPSSAQKKMLVSQYGYTQVNKIGAKRTDKKPSSHDRSQSADNMPTNVQVRTTGGHKFRNDNETKEKNDTISSSHSLGELCSTQRSQSSVCNEEVAPAVPVRSDSMRKNTAGGPGFALECFVPDCITIISADGSREVVTPNGHLHTTTAVTAAEAEASTGSTAPAPQSNKSKAVVRSKSSPQIPLPKDLADGSTSKSSIPDPPSEPHPEAIPYKIVKVGPIKQNDYKMFNTTQLATRPLPECPGKGEGATGPVTDCGETSQKESLPSEKDRSADSSVFPPFPVILHNDQDHKSKNRHSGNYKVPIFIKHQDYDNLGTVRADQDYEAMQLSKQSDSNAEVTPKPEAGNGLQEDQYYLKPDGSDRLLSKESSLPQENIVREDEYEVVSHSEDQIKPVSESDQKTEDVLQKETTTKKIPTKPPRRSRSQTHPLFCQEGHLVSSGESKSSQSTPETASKVKRTAPRAPVFSREDTMPRMPPPPPPTDESRRLSKDLQEGILRYHCSGGVAANSPKGKNRLNQNLGSPSSPKNPMKPEVRPIPESVSPEGEENVNPVPSIDENKSKEGSSPRQNKVKATPNLTVSPGKGRSAPKPLISPPKMHLLHYLGESPPSNTANENRQKEKKSLMFWKKRKRKDDGGSPEREYNTDFVAQWLEKLRHSPPLTTRRSWERMEVINAYKGQETAVIGYNGQHDGDIPVGSLDTASAKRRAPKPPKEGTASSDSTSSQPIPENKAQDNERGMVARGLTAKGDGQGGGRVEECPVKPPPRTQSQRRRRSNTVHDLPEYVNLAYLKQNKTPPTKPHRRVRGTRSLTTGFENIPSATKRLAPKNPDEEAARKLSTSALPSSASDLALSSRGSRDPVDPHAPLKSALKKVPPEGEDDKPRNGNEPPRRPVRMVPSDEDPLEGSGNQYGLPKSGYVNLEVKQVDLANSPEEEEEAAASLSFRDADLVLGQVQSMQCQVLLGAGELYPQPALEKTVFQDKTWEDFILHERTVMFSDERTFCFRAELKENRQELCLMVFLYQHQLDRIFEASCELESCPPHPNMLNIVHTFRATLPAYLFNNTQDEASQSNCRDSPCSQSEAVVVITSQIPTSTATLFLEESASRDCSEKYEEDVWCMVLQLCRGVAHAQKHEPQLSLEGLKQESVLRMGVGSSIWLFNPLLVSTLATPSTGRRDSVVSHLTDKCCEFDLGILIYELLGQPNPFAVRTSLMSRNYTPDDLPSLPGATPYSPKLTAVVHECLQRCPEERTHMDDAVWMVSALTFCPSLVSGSSERNDSLDIPALNQLIVMKQTERVCALAAQISTPREFTIWEKLEFLFWSEVDSAKLQRALNIVMK